MAEFGSRDLQLPPKLDDVWLLTKPRLIVLVIDEVICWPCFGVWSDPGSDMRLARLRRSDVRCLGEQTEKPCPCSSRRVGGVKQRTGNHRPHHSGFNVIGRARLSAAAVGACLQRYGLCLGVQAGRILV